VTVPSRWAARRWQARTTAGHEGTLTFPTGQTTENITGTLIDDPGANKTLTFTLGTPSSNAGLGSPVVNTLTIAESPAPAPFLAELSQITA